MRDKNLLMKQCELLKDMRLMEQKIEAQGVCINDDYLDGYFYKAMDNVIRQICISLGYNQYQEDVGEVLQAITTKDLAGFVGYLWDTYQNKESEIMPTDIMEMSRFFTPAQIGKYLNLDIADDISLRDFDEALSNRNLWNYPISECSELIENDIHAVLVKIEDGFRFVELPSEQ